jgi:hypothetical protein
MTSYNVILILQLAIHDRTASGVGNMGTAFLNVLPHKEGANLEKGDGRGEN